jgi:hypothetical protein
MSSTCDIHIYSQRMLFFQIMLQYFNILPDLSATFQSTLQIITNSPISLPICHLQFQLDLKATACVLQYWNLTIIEL